MAHEVKVGALSANAASAAATSVEGPDGPGHNPVTVGTGLDITDAQVLTLDLSEVTAGGELAGVLSAPTVDALHSGSTHAATQAAAEATAEAALGTHEAAGDAHPGYTTAAELATALADYQPLDADLTAFAGLGIGIAGSVLASDGAVPAWVGNSGAARAYNSGVQAIGSGAGFVAVTMDSERYDSANFHSTLSNTSRLTIPAGRGGLYHVGASIGLAAAAGGTYRYLGLLLNGTTWLAVTRGPFDATQITRMTVVADYLLVATDYVEAVLAQDSGGNLNTEVLVASSPEIWLHRFGV